MSLLIPEGFFETTLSQPLTTSATTVSPVALPQRITTGYMVIEPLSATKREVVFFTSVGVSSVSTADDTTDASDTLGRGCLGSITQGAATAHDQGVTVIIASVEQYWKRLHTAFTAEHSTAGAHTAAALSAAIYAADAGSTDTYAITLSPVPADYTTGMVVRFKANTVNTGAATLNVNSLGAKTIVKHLNVTLANSDIKANQLVEVIYDGTDFQLLSPIERITPRILSAASYTTDTGASLNIDNLDQFIVTAQAGALLFNNPTGTPKEGQRLLIAVTGTAARALTYGAQFEASTVALPTTTVTTARLNMLFIWRVDTSKWAIVANS